MNLIDIGNSKGIRLSKTIINKYGFKQGITLVEEKNYIKLVPLKKIIRQNWEKFYKNNANKLDIDLDFLECGIGDGIE